MTEFDDMTDPNDIAIVAEMRDKISDYLIGKHVDHAINALIRVLSASACLASDGDDNNHSAIVAKIMVHFMTCSASMYQNSFSADDKTKH
jgi:hypothetical protein